MTPSPAAEKTPADSGAPTNPRRRRFLRRALIGGAVVAAGAVGARFAHPLRRRELIVTLPHLPPGFEGFRIGVVSDMHRSPVISEDHCRRAAALLRAASCDLIADLGDNVSWSAGYASSALAAFHGVRPPAGKFAVLGNHEHWTGAAQGRRALEKAGFEVLANGHAVLRRGQERLWLVGVDDVWAGRPDIAAAFAGVPKDACVIVLSHNPDAIYDARVRATDLVLAGHTHGGQVLGSSKLVPNCRYGRDHPHGLYREGRSWIYVTSGVGMISPGIRLGVPPGVAVVTLIRA